MSEAKWKTVSLPRALTDDIQELIDESGYWPSMGSFIREAALEKLHKERSRGRGRSSRSPSFSSRKRANTLKIPSSLYLSPT